MRCSKPWMARPPWPTGSRSRPSASSMLIASSGRQLRGSEPRKSATNDKPSALTFDLPQDPSATSAIGSSLSSPNCRCRQATTLTQSLGLQWSEAHSFLRDICCAASATRCRARTSATKNRRGWPNGRPYFTGIDPIRFCASIYGAFIKPSGLGRSGVTGFGNAALFLSYP